MGGHYLKIKDRSVDGNSGGGFQDRTAWYVSLSSYWFASSFKWFVLLTVVLPRQVAEIVPEGTKNTDWGLVFGLGALWATIGPSLFGAFSDRQGRRAGFISAGAALTVVALSVLALSATLWQIAAGYLLLQIADDVGTGPYSALIPQYVPKERRGRASGLMNLLSLAGQLSAGGIAFAFSGSPRIVYSAIGIVTAVGALIAVRTVRGLEQAAVAPERKPFAREFLKGWIAPWKSPNFFLVWFAHLMFALGLYLTQPYLRNYLVDVIRIFQVGPIRLKDGDQATTVLALLITIFAAAGSILGGGWSDRMGRKRVIFVGGGLMACALVPFFLLHRYDLLLVIGALFGIGYGLYLSAEWALAADVMPSEASLGRDMGIWQMSDSVVQIFAGSAGRMVDWGNHQNMGLGYQMSFGIGALAFLVGIAAVRFIRSST